jgi:hypothetical protein
MVHPGAAEACNGVDDNCDGQTDEGVLNRCQACGPEPEETCDGADNDCDGLTDENCPGPDAGQPDAGQPDAGQPDAGQPDAAQPTDSSVNDAGPDGAKAPDQGSTQDPEIQGGCGCGPVGLDEGWILTLVLLSMVVRRRGWPLKRR